LLDADWLIVVELLQILGFSGGWLLQEFVHSSQIVAIIVNVKDLVDIC